MASRPAMSIEEIIRRKVSSLRYWKKSNLYRKHSNWKFQFSVMTYNILSQTAVDNHRYLYRNCNPSFLRENYRVSMVLPEIMHSKSDIVCLQEVEQFVYEARLKNILEQRGFGSIFMKRTCNKTDGCAIFWRQDKFQLVGQNGIEFQTKDAEILNRDNIGLIAVLKPNHRNAGNVLLHVATTHLLYNPKRGDIKMCQLRWLLAELERMALIDVKNDVRRYQPVILCGDLNIQPHSPLYQFIETGRINVANTTCGDLSGQIKNKNAGRPIRFETLKLDKIGINKGSRFENEPPKKHQKRKTQPNQQVQKMPPNPRPTMVNNTGMSQHYGHPMVNMATCDPRFMHPVPLMQFHNHQPPNHKQSTPPPQHNPSTGSSTVDGAKESDSDETCFSHDFKLVPVYKFHNMSEGTIPITSMVGDDAHTVDHIFYNVDIKRDNHSFREGVLKLLAWYTLLTKEDLKELGGLPNAGLGSDHICLGARFAISL
ncbi:hypothetical protein JTE90_006685 [Oedothorax gibbosus]|uniref:Endonuclease/exonuclease/phosphatase domain-containing protein n=1 Tax=Oedothorax gibbosus TaxID=931172 RepID=A0AAV6V1Y2_9ARAC|nr:hypothetical protein JTE90_006685 [Oedothorax gibbosus]